ncbi:MAG: discoidin domain-containing protein [Verrucomicrobiales bacterium]|nr:discoidin domain-containing protein [Verrucomicrobiales bacterium]
MPLLVCPCFSQDEGVGDGEADAELPAEVLALMQSFSAKLELSIKPIREAVSTKLKAMEVRMGHDERFDEGLVVKEFKQLLLDQPVAEAGTMDIPLNPPELRKELEYYGERCNRSAAPWRKIFINEIEKLKVGYIDAGRLEDAKLASEEGARLRGLWDVSSRKKGRVNLALASAGATAYGEKRPEAMIDGNSRKYDDADGWAAVSIPGSLRVELEKRSTLTQVRFKLWCKDAKRRYKYKIFLSKGGQTWELLADMSDTFCRDWQEFNFSPRSVKGIRIEGVGTTSKYPWFHIVELEAY